jgi:pyruvate dehydrogenase E1 component alpha subunit
MHIADFAAGMLGANGVVGGGIGIAVGAAQGARLLGKHAISACFFGDGAVNRGPFLEGLNWASVFRLPVLFVCEDNQFSAFTRASDMTAGKGAPVRAEAIGVESRTVDGNDVFAVYDGAAELLAKIRSAGGPAFLHAPTYRLDGHTVFDKAAYRAESEVEAKRQTDPIVVLERALVAMGASPVAFEGMRAEARVEMEGAMVAARNAPPPHESDAYGDVQIVGAPA